MFNQGDIIGCVVDDELTSVAIVVYVDRYYISLTNIILNRYAVTGWYASLIYVESPNYQRSRVISQEEYLKFKLKYEN